MTDQSTPTTEEQILNQGLEDDGRGESGQSKEQRQEAAEGSEPLELGSQEAPEATPEQIAAEEEKKRSRPWSKRVDALTARLREAERENAELRSGRAPNAAAPEAPKAPDPNEVGADGKPRYEFGAADPDYIKDAAIFAVEQKFAKEAEDGRKASAENAAKSAVAEKINSGMANVEKAGAEKYDDFEEKISAAVEARGGESLQPLVGLAIAVSPVGADIAYRLATDEAASDRIEALAKSDPLKAAQAFGELEGEYTDDDDDLNLADPLDMARALGRMRARVKGTKAPVERKVTRAPKPAEHRARGGTGQFEVGDDTDDFAAFERKHMGRSK